jgi:FkbM family methyltransferase
MSQTSPETTFLRHGRYGHLLACDGNVSPLIRQSIIEGSYEWPGGLRLAELVRGGDKVLELGGGLGCLATLVCLRKAVASYCVVEANGQLMPLLASTLAANGIQNARVHNVVLTDEADALARGHVDFYLHEDFWASSLRRVEGSKSKTTVPARSLSAWVEHHKPDVIHCDIEGAEAGLFTQSELAGVRALSIELHHDVVPAEAERRLRTELAAKGFRCEDAHPIGGVLVFQR